MRFPVVGGAFPSSCSGYIKKLAMRFPAVAPDAVPEAFPHAVPVSIRSGVSGDVRVVLHGVPGGVPEDFLGSSPTDVSMCCLVVRECEYFCIRFGGCFRRCSSGCSGWCIE